MAIVWRRRFDGIRNFFGSDSGNALASVKRWHGYPLAFVTAVNNRACGAGGLACVAARKRAPVRVCSFGMKSIVAMNADDIDRKPMQFTTDAVPEHERLARWREEFGKTIISVDIAPLAPEEPFRAEALLQRLPGVRIALCDGSAAEFTRTRAQAAAGGDPVWMIVNLGEPAFALQRDTELTLGIGDAVLVRPDEPGRLRGVTHLDLAIPHAPLAERLHDLDGVFMKPAPASHEALRLFMRYLRMVLSEPKPEESALQQAIVNHIHDLAALAFGATRDTSEQGRRAIAAARLAAVVEHIGKHFADPALSVASVALHHDISPRYLHELLEQSGASFVARVNELRLKRAFALLTRFPNRAVAEIAAQAGFSNVSHFNRLFRMRFGASPSGVRSRS
ncbi:AraC family transcriptional regulator [Bradyrhizobium diazoefficiens]|uniref:AraC family transcriptional regulator n=1 Tax=Bradyrhizobium diazoefficiens TaxID=1355477 RepID=UPI00190DB2CE|nr:AraC family transcriptional regulator [Bradyrhizobium diazoefficiens]QQO15249.1 AraC family transcriptional regulator [Bradyrhizobium diazoefficiens]